MISDEKLTTDPEFRPKWENRRRLLFTIITFCAGIIFYILYKNLDTQVADTAMTMSWLTMISTFGMYMGGSHLDTANFREVLTKRE